MQKLLILSICLLNMSLSHAQCPLVITNGKLGGILPVTGQKVAYSDVVDCGSVSQLDLFKRARLWVAQSSISATPPVVSDKETGDLVSHETMTVTLPRSESFAGGVYTLRYSLIVECANRKYRVTLTQFAVQESGSPRAVPIETYCQKVDKDRQSLYTELDKQANDLLFSLQEAVKAYKSF